MTIELRKESFVQKNVPFGVEALRIFSIPISWLSVLCGFTGLDYRIGFVVV